MATLLDTYIESKNNFDNGTQAALPGPAEIWQRQELLYRIGVLEACRLLGKTAPLSAEPKELYWHYQIVDAFFQNLSLERRSGMVVDENHQKRRETAHESLFFRARFL